MPPLRPPTAGDVTRLILLGAIWGSTFMWIEIALADFAPTSIVAARILLGAGLLLAFARWRGEPWPRGRAIWGLIFLIGLINNAVPFFLISWGQQYVASSLAAILLGIGPFLNLALAHWFTRDDRLTWPKLGAMVLGFAGIVVLVAPGLLAGPLDAALLGQAAVLLASLCYAVANLLTRRLTGQVAPVMSAGVTLASAALYTLPVALTLDRPWEMAPPGWPALGALILLGMLPTGLAFVLRFRMIAEVGTTFSAQVAYLIPLFGVAYGWTFLSERPSALALLALLLILSGIGLSQQRRR